MRKGKRWLAAAVSAAMIVQSLASVGPVYAADDGVSIADTNLNIIPTLKAFKILWKRKRK